MSILETFPIVADYRAASGFDGPWRSAVHSGNIGDIIYSLPTCRMLEINHYILNLCADPAFGGRVLLERSARSLAPLLLAQKYIRRVTIIKSNVPLEYAVPADLGVDYILDSFRASFTNYRLHLLYAHAVPYNLTIDGSQPWLTYDREQETPPVPREPYIVVGLTHRYRRFEHSYYENLLRNVPADRVYFVGIENDQIERANIGGTAVRVTDFLELVRLIANAALFIGNPSFSYALAESLKVPRFVEVPEVNNVYPLDGSGWLLHQCDNAFVRSKIFEKLELHDQADHCFADLRANLVQTEQEFATQQARLAELTHGHHDLRHEHDCLRHEHDCLRHEHDCLRHEHGHLRHEHDCLRHEHDLLRHEHNCQIQAIAHLEGLLQRETATRSRLEIELDIANQHAAAFENALIQTKRSLTWRLVHRARRVPILVRVFNGARRTARPFAQWARTIRPFVSRG